MGRAGRRAPTQRGGLPEAKRKGRARNRREGLEAELQRLDLGAEAAAPTGTGLVWVEDPKEEAAEWVALTERCVRVEGRAATEEEMLLVHSPKDAAEEETPGAAPPPQHSDPPLRAVGALLALLGRALSGDVRNGLALLGPYGSYSPPVDPIAIAARAAQKHPGVQRVLIVDWCAPPRTDTPRLFQDDPSVVYFGVHWGHDPPPAVGGARGDGCTVELRWDDPGVTDGDYAAAFLHLLLPIAFEFQPHIVLVAAACDPALGDTEGRVGLSAVGVALLTHLLAALAGGRLLLAFQGGWQPGGPSAALRTLLGDPGDPPGPIVPTPSGLASIARTMEAYSKYWSGLRGEPEVEDEPDDDEEEEGEEAGKDEEVGGDDEVTEPPPAPPVGPRPRPTARTALVYDERMEEHYNPWDSQHPECPQRLSRTLQRLWDLGLTQRCLLLPPQPAQPPQLRACHTRSHVEALAATEGLRPRELRGAAARYNSVFLCPQSYACACLAAGAACCAVSAVLSGQVQNALALVRPPGHHAAPGAAGGFCLFNNVAVAARHAQRMAGGALRVMIVDWDVHHGDGTQRIFEDDPSVLYVSLHRHDGSFFPGGSGGSPWRRGRGGGRGYTVNVGWGGPRVADPDYVAAATRLLLPIACQFAPQLLLISAGFDAARGDPLGGCHVTPPTWGLLCHLLAATAGGRCVLVLEGGYNLEATAEGVSRCLAVLLGDPPSLPPPGPPQPAALLSIARTRRAQGGLWECLRLPPPKAPPEEPPPPRDDAPPLDAILRLGELHLGDPPQPEDPLEGAAASPPSPPCCEEELEEEGALFAVTPLLSCPHLEAVAPLPGRGLEEAAPPCGVCGSRRENWVCLSCYEVLCSRYVGGHMLAHGGATGHPLVLSLQDLGAWCYPCGGYVHHPVLFPAKALLHRLKFGVDPPSI